MIVTLIMIRMICISPCISQRVQKILMVSKDCVPGRKKNCYSKAAFVYCHVSFNASEFEGIQGEYILEGKIAQTGLITNGVICLLPCIIYTSGAVVAQWIWTQTLNGEVPGSNLLAAAVVPLGKALCPHRLVPWKWPTAIGPLVDPLAHKELVFLALARWNEYNYQSLNGFRRAHRRTGPVSFRGAEVSCPNILSIACPKIKWFCPNITWFFFFARIWLAAAPPPPPPPPPLPPASYAYGRAYAKRK